VLQVPHELLDKLDKLAPHTQWPSQSWATIIAATIAVIAALVALSGALYSANRSAREAQLDRDADKQQARRTERSQLLSQSLDIARLLTQMIFALPDEPPETPHPDFVQKWNEGVLLIDLLDLTELPRSSEALLHFIHAAADAYSSREEQDMDRLMMSRKALVDTFSQELASESGPEGKPVRSTRIAGRLKTAESA
jgi:hypothetical protein